MEAEESFEEYWDRCEILITKCKREKINEKFYYMMATMFVNKKEKKLSEEEKRKLSEILEKEENSDRVPKEEEIVIDSLKKEMKRLKIENNRSEPEKSVHYGDRMSRRDHKNWSAYKGNQSNQRSGSRSEYQRSDSHLLFSIFNL